MEKNLYKEMFDNLPPEPGLPDETKFPRIIPSKIPRSVKTIGENLNTYIQMLLEGGVDEAKIISSIDIPQDPRVILKCSHPKCPGYGRSGSCPPHFIGDYGKAKEYLKAYNWAIVYRKYIPTEGLRFLSSPSLVETIRAKEQRHALGSLLRYVYGKGDLVERAAFYDGYYFAINCHFGPCLYQYCEKFKNCQEIEMGVCRFPYKAKPSPEQTFCIDFLKLASQLGWDYYMLGPCVFPEDLPNSYRPYLIGLILIT
jgi:predicted metal-binding protein